MKPSKSTIWIFRIDTDTYTGNFERELASYVTGQQASRYHGEREARAFQRTITGDPFAALITKVTRDGYASFCDIAITPKVRDQKYQSVVIYFRRRPTAELIQILETRAREFAVTPGKNRCGGVRPAFQITGFALIRQVQTVRQREEPI